MLSCFFISFFLFRSLFITMLLCHHDSYFISPQHNTLVFRKEEKMSVVWGDSIFDPELIFKYRVS
ncbi:hypothetical protein M758_7G180900 [Ceratodon purpureus]|uniref:Secreted protein n=1 Tax=Ceratodon purpureus TaxID=3225 RepID=A0A8T0HBK5_CERPU|nr:hypothetical protein KC19_7G183200 [Ceratodon purpureus]KAG0611977.1 hypothetical protein M758_7G180900 [Ceratodon purpureus]